MPIISGPSASSGPGKEIGYDQITASVNIVATTTGTATVIIAGSAYTFDGAAVIAEVYTAALSTPAAAATNNSILQINEGATVIALVAVLSTAAAVAIDSPVLARYRFTPTAGSHTYSLRAYATNTTGTPAVTAGAAAGGFPPAYLRFTKV